jgi:hypothetical protein
MRLDAVGDLIAYARRQDELAAVLELGIEATVEAPQNMTLLAPVIGQIAGRLFDDADAYVAEILRPPDRLAGRGSMLGRRGRAPVGGAEGVPCIFM